MKRMTCHGRFHKPHVVVGTVATRSPAIYLIPWKNCFLMFTLIVKRADMRFFQSNTIWHETAWDFVTHFAKMGLFAVCIVWLNLVEKPQPSTDCKIGGNLSENLQQRTRGKFLRQTICKYFLLVCKKRGAGCSWRVKNNLPNRKDNPQLNYTFIQSMRKLLNCHE